MSNKVTDVLTKIDRAEFSFLDPYRDQPQQIGFSATISAPHMHAWALSVLEK
jgi:protein-L-isoaspartate(D-aspartate) O-methyltransferase